ncbi:Flagellar hook-associated protein 3 [Sphingomonas sp. EC-HK361]|uniref:flagellar hook-associated protein FlgL n=1 Tax=Sphingomonas sp. EC-HK361 TaxID=2038397 RepID=UPI001259FE13|nr:flagellar hook-associated protein FlgL [Sphingomonas sp. EC-HK361]VVT16293.1 Flagellar hook-associated protein 3 [Sphingomonas sp. EC-HK361]
MQVSTSLFYDRASQRMSSLSSKIDTINAQISSGKKLLAPDDDSVAYQRLQSIARDTSDAAAYAKNLSVAKLAFSQADSTLTSLTQRLQRANELATQAANGTVSPTDKQAIAAELDKIIDDVVSFANTTDARGQPVFGGTNGTTAVTRTGSTITFSAGTQAAIPISADQDVVAGVNAETFLKLPSGADVVSVLSALRDQLNAGGVVDTAGAQADITSISTQVTSTQAALGARAARVDLQQTIQTDDATNREIARSSLEDVDVTDAYVQLQKQMTALQATQASFSKLTGLSLFDYLR